MNTSLKHLVMAKDGTLSLHKVGNLVAQAILGIVVGYSFYRGNIPLMDVFIYMGVISGNSLILQAAEYMDKKSPSDLNKAQKVYHQIVGDVMSQITQISDSLTTNPPKSGTGTSNSGGNEGNVGPNPGNAQVKNSGSTSGPSADEQSNTNNSGS